MPVTTTDYRTLSVPDRLKLISEIWDSIAEEGVSPPLSDSQKAELRRRVKADMANPDESIPWEEVKRAGREGR